MLSAKSPAIPVIAGVPVLVPTQVSGREGINTLFDYTVTLAANLASGGATQAVAADDFLGKELTIFIAQAAASPAREISGVITAIDSLPSSGELRLKLEPWLRLAAYNANCRIFQDRSVVEIIELVLGQYDFQVEKRLHETYPKRDHTTQYNESDFNFFERLCQSWGINYFFAHGDGSHRLVLIDSNAAYQKSKNPAYHTLPFMQNAPLSKTEYIDRFDLSQQLGPNKYTTRDYDYIRPKADLTASEGETSSPHAAEIYTYHLGTHYAQPKAGAQQTSNTPLDEGKALARMRLEAHQTSNRRASGTGALRGLIAGSSFTLDRHPDAQANIDYLVAATTLELKSGGDGQHAFTQFVVVPLHGAPYRPAPPTTTPTIHTSTAIVVGPADKPIWTDNLGRIKVQFPWDRLGKNDENSGCWVRVASPWAGNQMGSQHLPRIGQEVLINFISGNPDLPLCTGSVHNQTNLPPWSTPNQSALSGWRSREFSDSGGNSASGRSNHLILDDTAGKIQAQLQSAHQQSQLNLGYVTLVEDNAGRKEERGEGLEAKTDGSAVLRGGKGVLVTAAPLAAAKAGMLSRDELVSALDQALAAAKQLGDAAASAKGSARTPQPQSDLKEAISALGHGTGDEATAGGGAAGQAVIAFSAPDGIASATAKSHTCYAAQNVDIVAGQNLQAYANENILHTAAQGIEQQAIDGDLKLIAGKGKVVQLALANTMELEASKQLTIKSSTDGIVIEATTSITLTVGAQSISITKTGININGRMLNLQSDSPKFIPFQ